MATSDRRIHRPARRAPGRIRDTVATVVRSLLLGAAVFALAAFAGALLSGAAPADPADPATTNPTATGLAATDSAVSGSVATAPAAAEPSTDLTLAQSMIYTGSAGLAVSLAGLALVGWRRRLW